MIGYLLANPELCVSLGILAAFIIFLVLVYHTSGKRTPDPNEKEDGN